MSLKKNLIAIAVATAMVTTVAHAAKVPAGTKLAAKQEITINNGAELQSLDPHKIEGVPESNVIRQMIEGLITTDENNAVKPGVAESWSSDDFKTWVFKLRKNAVWSNGDPVTAHDFVYSWRRLADPKTASPYASYLDYAKVANQAEILKGEKAPEELGVRAIDDHTFEVTLSEAVPYFPGMTQHTSLKPVNKNVVEKHGEAWTKPENWVGNGAYVLKEHINNEKLVIVRNDKYWNNGETVIDQATFYPIESDKVALNRFKAGELDYAPGSVPLELFDQVKKDMPNELKIAPRLCSYYYEINQNKVTNPKLREALKLAVDRDIIVEKITKAGQAPAYIFTPHSTQGAAFTDPEWSKLSQKEKNEKAKKLLEESGYDVNQPIEILYNTSEGHKKIAIAISSMWKQNLGIKTTLKNQEWKTFLDSRRQGKHQISRAGWCADYNEPSTFLNIFKSTSSNNQAFYKSEEFDKAMLDTLRVKTDAERAALYQKAEMLMDKDTAIIPVYHYVKVELVKPTLKGISQTDPMSAYYVKDLYVTE